MQALTSDILASLLSSKKNVAICAHLFPDGDAIGSALGLYHFCKNKGLNVTVVNPNDHAAFLHFLPGDEHIINHEDHTEEAEQVVAAADLIFILDLNDLKRVKGLQSAIEKNEGATRVMIDHHQEPKDIAHYALSRTSASSTAEMIFDCIDMLDEVDQVTPELADCLYTGLTTDTGRFKFSITPRVLQVASVLVEKGARPTWINQAIFDSFSEKRLRFLGFCLSKRMKILPEAKMAYIYISQSDFRRFNYHNETTEGIVNYPLSMADVEMAALLKEQDGKIKISFRSKGDLSVSDFARDHFRGGGHINAAGGMSTSSMEETIQKLEALVKSEIQPQLEAV